MYKVIEDRKRPFAGWETVGTTNFEDWQDALSHAKERYNELYGWVQDQGYRHENDISEEVCEEEGEFYAYTDACGPEINVEIVRD